MRLTPAMRDWLIDRVAQRLNAGTITILAAGDADDGVLVSIPFQSPAFEPARNAVAVSHDLPPSVNVATGEARRAQLATSTGEVIADVPVRSVDDPNSDPGDVILDRTDFQRGGVCTLTRVTLALPLRP